MYFPSRFLTRCVHQTQHVAKSPHGFSTFAPEKPYFCRRFDYSPVGTAQIFRAACLLISRRTDSPFHDRSTRQ
jgi:hypothetical protein